MTILKSKIADYLAEVSKTHNVFFNLGQSIMSGVQAAYYLEIYDKDTGYMERRIYLTPKTIDEDSVDRVRDIIKPFLEKYANDKLTREQVLDNWENGYFKTTPGGDD